MLFFSLLLLLGFVNGMPTNMESAYKAGLVGEGPSSILEATVLNKPLTLGLDELDAASYATTKANIGLLRRHLGEAFKQGDISFDQVKTEFTDHLVDKIIPHWYGTPWSFGGHTAVPNQGKIACGYFISTTLRDMGINLNRYKLAQKSPIDEAKVISCGADIYSVIQESSEKAFADIDRLTQEGLHFIGFDTGHVGYLLKRKGELLLIHSNYFWPASVCIEPLKTSRAFNSFSKFHLVDISNNEVLIQRWLDNGVVL
jgi:hypothetical protein